MAYKYIRVTYGWHEYIRVTYVRHANTYCFGLFTKFKKGRGISFWYIYFTCVFHKNAPYLILYQMTKLQCNIFWQDIKKMICIKFLFTQLMTSYTLRFIFSYPLSNWTREGNEGKSKIQKFAYLENEKNFLDEVKSIFHNYFNAVICWIQEKQRTQALNCLRILSNTIVIKSRSRTPTNNLDGTPCNDILI